VNAAQQSKGTRPADWLPLVFGIVALFVGAVYQAQRNGLFLHSFYAFDRFIQHHLDATGGTAEVLALLGVVIGLMVRWTRGRNRILTLGTAFSVIVILLLEFGTSL
jgi:hypothetical protein